MVVGCGVDVGKVVVTWELVVGLVVVVVVVVVTVVVLTSGVVVVDVAVV